MPTITFHEALPTTTPTTTFQKRPIDSLYEKAIYDMVWGLFDPILKFHSCVRRGTDYLFIYDIYDGTTFCKQFTVMKRGDDYQFHG